MAKPNLHPWLYRGAALLAFIIAQIAVLSVPLKMQEPDDWAFRYAAQHFAHGQLTIEDSQFVLDSQEIWQHGGQLICFGKVPGNRWALTWAPGYAFYLTPFEAAGIPWLGASIISLGLAAVLYLLLRRLRDEKTALFGVIILLFTPLYLAMWQRVYMDTLAATALSGMGGGLYLYYWLSPQEGSRWRAVSLLLAGFLLAASVAVRYTNISILLVFLIHFLFMTGRAAIGHKVFLRPLLFFGTGLVLPLAGLMAYQAVVFGSPLIYGGHYSQLPATFAWDYLGTPAAYNIVRSNVIQLWAPLLIGIPALFLSLPAMLVAGYGKIFTGQIRGWEELPGHAWWLLAGWFLAVFGLFLFYEWTAGLQTALIPFILATRFYLPALFPLALMAALALAHFPARIWGNILTALVVIGIVFFIQAARLQIQFSDGTTPSSLSLPLVENGNV